MVPQLHKNFLQNKGVQVYSHHLLPIAVTYRHRLLLSTTNPYCALLVMGVGDGW